MQLLADGEEYAACGRWLYGWNALLSVPSSSLPLAHPPACLRSLQWRSGQSAGGRCMWWHKNKKCVFIADWGQTWCLKPTKMCRPNSLFSLHCIALSNVMTLDPKRKESTSFIVIIADRRQTWWLWCLKKGFHLIHRLEGSSDPVPQRGGGIGGGTFHLVELNLVS